MRLGVREISDDCGRATWVASQLEAKSAFGFAVSGSIRGLDQRVSDAEGRETAEIMIGRPEFVDAVDQAKDGHSSVMHQRPRDSSLHHHAGQGFPIPA